MEIGTGAERGAAAARHISHHEDACRLAAAMAGDAFGVALPDMRARSRGPSATAFARQAAMYLAHVGLGLSLTRVGAHFDRDRTTVAHACAVIEDRRDDPGIDRVLTALETACEGWRRCSAAGARS